MFRSQAHAWAVTCVQITLQQRKEAFNTNYQQFYVRLKGFPSKHCPINLLPCMTTMIAKPKLNPTNANLTISVYVNAVSSLRRIQHT